MSSIYINIWTSVKRPKDKIVTPGKWGFEVNTKADDEKHKSRYVAESFKKNEGIDSFETFIPTSKPEKTWQNLSLAATEFQVETNGWEGSLLTSRNARRNIPWATNEF